jgi:hypothetical protein
VLTFGWIKQKCECLAAFGTLRRTASETVAPLCARHQHAHPTRDSPASHAAQVFSSEHTKLFQVILVFDPLTESRIVNELFQFSHRQLLHDTRLGRHLHIRLDYNVAEPHRNPQPLSRRSRNVGRVSERPRAEENHHPHIYAGCARRVRTPSSFLSFSISSLFTVPQGGPIGFTPSSCREQTWIRSSTTSL